MRRHGALWSMLLGFVALLPGSASAGHGDPQLNRDILKSLTPPPGFDLTVFATPPAVNYPTCLAAASGGEVFVGIDEQGSLGREPNRGRVVRCVDSDGDGIADQVTTFATPDHPRGLIWDDAGRALYVLHPPRLTRYHDNNRDGVAERSEILVDGIWNEKATTERGADHTTNGIRLGIDGWIYIAVGDFGVSDAIGTDGTRLKLQGGGIVRVRTDGTDLETYATGMRNIYDVAIDPLMNVFTRDNTNDGDGWNDRLTYSVPGSYHGYPNRFKRFPAEIVDCMIDFGSGSPCGVLFVDEPALPEQHRRSLYTVEWGLNRVDRHPLAADGAGFKASTEKLLDFPRGTDIDVDGSGRMYISSWTNGGFRYTDPNVGYIIRLSPKDHIAPDFPVLRDAGDEQLLEHLASRSGVCRLAAQREMLRRGDRSVFAEGLAELAASDAPIAARAAAIFTLKLLRGATANAALVDFCRRDELREFALRALADRRHDHAVPTAAFIEGLRDANPRVRLMAAWGIGRLGLAPSAPAVVPLTSDPDPLVSHVAVNSLVELNAIGACLDAVATSDPRMAEGALNALQRIHDPAVVDGLTEQLGRQNDAALRTRIFRALCRLYWREDDWDGSSWWGTRPDTTGPYFRPVAWSGTPRVADLIRRALANESPPVVRSLLLDGAANRIDLPELFARLMQADMKDPDLCGAFLNLLADRKGLPEQQIAVVKEITRSDVTSPAVRAQAIRVLSEDAENVAAIEAAVDALGRVTTSDEPGAELAAALDSFIQNPERAKHIELLSRLADSGSPGQREVALATLIGVVRSKLAEPQPRAAAEAVIARSWDDADATVPLLRAIGRMKAKRYGDQVRARMRDNDEAISRAAGFAAERLGITSAATGPAPRDVTIASLGLAKALESVRELEGDITRGQELYKSQGCVACHTVLATEVPKGPFLGGIASRYRRAELFEAILTPSAKIAQGFETQWFKTRTDVIEGFVTRESGDEIELRNITGNSVVLRKNAVTSRGKREISAMPEGLAAKLSLKELADLLAYLESLKN